VDDHMTDLGGANKSAPWAHVTEVRRV